MHELASSREQTNDPKSTNAPVHGSRVNTRRFLFFFPSSLQFPSPIFIVCVSTCQINKSNPRAASTLCRESNTIVQKKKTRAASQECAETRVIKSKRYSICTMHRKPLVLQLLVQMRRMKITELFKYNVVGSRDYNYGVEPNEINQIW